MDDEADTDFKCSTNKVSAFTLKTSKVKKLLEKHQSLKTAVTDLQKRLEGKVIALDYIIHNNEKAQDDYDRRLRHNQIRVKFKDAIMQLWSKYKKANTKPNMGDVVKRLIREKKGSTQEDEQKEKKMKRRAERKQKDKEILLKESANSYLKIEQYQSIVDGCKFYKSRLH